MEAFLKETEIHLKMQGNDPKTLTSSPIAQVTSKLGCFMDTSLVTGWISTGNAKESHGPARLGPSSHNRNRPRGTRILAHGNGARVGANCCNLNY